MTEHADLAATANCFCLAARRTARTVTRLYEERLRPHGLRATQFSILASLALKGPTPIGELADALGLERTTLTRSAALLERQGWLRGVRPKDARKHPLQVTPAGRSKLAEALPAWQAAQEFAGRELGRFDLRGGHVEPEDSENLTSIVARYPGRVAPDLAGWERGCWRRWRLIESPIGVDRTAA
jgi:DNA-binding MarR family transcriptional regulator